MRRCKGGGQRTEYRVRITEHGLRGTEGWQGDGRCTANGRDAVAPLPEGGAREIGQHVVLSLPEAVHNRDPQPTTRYPNFTEAARLARSANPTSIQCCPYPIQAWGVALRGKVLSLKECWVSSN